MNCATAKPISVNSLCHFYQTNVGSGRSPRFCFKTKAKLSAETNIVEKESTSVNEKIGNSSCLILCSFMLQIFLHFSCIWIESQYAMLVLLK